MQGTPHIASTPHDGRPPSGPPARRARYTEEQYTARAPYGAQAQYTDRGAGLDVPPRMPHQVAEPRVTPVARLPQAADPQPPIFIDQTGWRRRTLQGLALAVGCACLGYLLFVGTLVSGLWQPVGSRPPSTDGPAPTGPESGKSPRGSGAQARDEAQGQPSRAHADRDDRRRPPSGRSAPPAGGLKP
ncbi:hypothetical protein [Streptomyces sp. NPDC057302]|uniref:hypothetical protein n=1 Tax=Streptomyces sp. NPDC057302 TaxID=3346094 RepID=UPI0036451BC1